MDGNTSSTANHDYYQFYYQDCSDNDSSASNEDYTAVGAYQSPPLSPRMALFPDLQSLSSNLKRRALSIHGSSSNNDTSCHQDIEAISQIDTSPHLTEEISNDLQAENQCDDQVFDQNLSTEELAESDFKNEELSFESDNSSLLSFSSSGIASTLTSSSFSPNDGSLLSEDGVSLKRIRSDSTLSKGGDDVRFNHVVASDRSKKLSLIDIIKKRSHAVDEDFSGSKTIDYRKRKRADSPIMFLMRRTKSLSSKDKDHQGSSETTFTESKKSIMSSFNDSANENTLVQPSPFVRTIFQFVESSFDDDYFSLGLNSKSSEEIVTVYSTSNMKTLSGSKPFKSKSRPTHHSSLELSVAAEKSEPVYLSTDRRISENSEFIISAMAYLDRIRKAKTKEGKPKTPKSRSRQRRCKSDPGLNYVKLRRFLDTYNDLKSHGSSELAYPKNAEKYNVNMISHKREPLSLHRRFQLLSFSSNDDSYSYKTDGISESNKNLTSGSQDSFRSKAHRVTSTFASKKKSLKKFENKQRESLSSEIERLNELNDDLTKFSASLRSNQNKTFDEQNDQNKTPSQEIKRSITTVDKNNILARQGDDIFCYDIETTSDEGFVIEDTTKMFRNSNSDKSYESGDTDEVNLFIEKTVYDVKTNYSNLHNDNFLLENSLNDQNDLQTQLTDEKSNSFENNRDKFITLGTIDNEENQNNRGNSEQDICLTKRLQSESPCGENNNKKIRIRVGSLSDKLKRKHSAKKFTSDDIEYWVGEFKPSISDSSIKKAEKAKENNTLIGNFKKQFNSIRKKDKKSPDIVEMNVLRRVSSRSNEDVNTAHKKTSLKQRSASFRLKRDKHYGVGEDRNDHAKVSTIRSVFETSTNGENLKKKWKLASPKVKSAHKMVSFFQNVRKDKSNSQNGSASPIKNAKIKFIQYNSSPRLSPAVKVDNKSNIVRKLTTDSPYLSRRSPQVELMRRHFEKSGSRQSNNSDYSSICSSNSNSITSSENLNTDDEKLDSGNHSAESINGRQLTDIHRKSMRKSMSLDCLVKSPLFESSGKVYSSHDKMNDISRLTPTLMKLEGCTKVTDDITKRESPGAGAIVVDVPSHLVPEEIKRGDTKRLQTHTENKHVNTSSEDRSIQAVSPLKPSYKNDSCDESTTKKGLIDPNKVSEEAFIKQLLTENENLGFQLNVPIGSDTSDDSNSQDSLNDSFETLTLKDDVSTFSDVPSIPQPLLLKTDEKSYGSYSSYSLFSSSTPSYTSYASSASHIFNDVANLYSTTKNGVSRKKSSDPPPVKPKPKILKKVTVDKETNQPSNVALVTPFLKEDLTKEATDNLMNSDSNEENFNESDDIFSKSVGFNQLTRKPSVIWAIVKKMEIALLLDTDTEAESDNELKMESFEVRRVNNYEDVEELAVDTFIKHLKLLDKQMLDLTKDDIEFIQMGVHRVLIGDRKFDLSTLQIDDGFLRCNLCIQGKHSWSLASLCYDTLIPKEYLEKYCCLILSQFFVVFFGPSGNSKSYLASKLASFVSYRANSGNVAPHVYRNITTKSWQKLLSDVPDLIKQKQSMVIVLDGFSHEFIDSGVDISVLAEQLNNVQPPIYVICTLSQNPNRTVPMEWQIKFKWIWLPLHEEPINGLLQRFLRRKFIQYGNPHLQKEFFRIVDWLNNVWKNINKIIEKFYSVEATLGPTLLYSCPTDILNAEEWFIDTWNYSIAPYFIQAIRQGIESRGHVPDWEDPLEIVLQSYPWLGEKAKKKMKLRDIRLEDIGFRESCVYNFDSLAEQKRLMSFLKQLETLILDGGLGEIPSFKKLEYLESSL